MNTTGYPRKLMTRLYYRAATHYPLDLGGRVEDTLLICGVGRSGTTWLAEFINFDGRYRDLFEPFHAWMIPGAAVLRGHWYQRPGDTPPAPFANYVERVLRGRIRHPWVDRFNRRPLSHRRLVKAIRADLFLGWIAARYPDLKIIHLIRHPAAVAQSRARLPAGWEWRPTLAEMLEQDRLRAVLTTAQAQLCRTVSTPFQECILTWCLSIRAALSHLPEERALCIHYEALLNEPREQMQLVFKYLARPWDSRCLKASSVSSRTARGRVAHDRIDPSGIAPWIRKMTTRERAWLDLALENFGLASLYTDTGYPNQTLRHSLFPETNIAGT